MIQWHVTEAISLTQPENWLKVQVSSDQRTVWLVAVSGLSAPALGLELTQPILTINAATIEEWYQATSQVLTQAQQRDVDISLASIWTDGGSELVAAAYQATVLLSTTAKTGVLVPATGELVIRQGKLEYQAHTWLLTRKAEQFSEDITRRLDQGYDPISLIGELQHTLHANQQLTKVGIVHAAQSVVDSVDTAPDQPQDEKINTKLPLSPKLNIEMIEESHQTQPQQPSVSTVTNSPPNQQRPTEVDSVKSVSVSASSNAVEKKHQSPFILALSITKVLLSMVGATFKRLVPIAKSGATLLSKQVSSFVKKSVGFGQMMISPTDAYAGEHPRKKILRWLLPIGILLAVLVVGLVGWQWRRAQDQQAAVAVLAPILTEYEQLEQLSQQDPVAARTGIDRVLSQLTDLQLQFNNQPAGQQIILNRLAEVEQLAQHVSGQMAAESLPVAVDLRQASNSFVTSQASLRENQVMFFDQNQQQLLVWNTQSDELTAIDLAGLELPQVTQIEWLGEDLVLLGEGIRTLQISDSTITQLRPEGDSNRQGSLLGSFDQFVYVFNPEERNIYRYSPQPDSTEYSEPIGWLIDRQGLDFATVRDWAIDGSIWLSDQQGVVRRFTQGSNDDFGLVDFEEPFSSEVLLFTQPEYRNVYLLEPATNRLVVINQDGVLLREITSMVLGSAVDLLVPPSEELVWVVSGGEVYEVELE